MERLGIIAVSVRDKRRGFAFAEWIAELAAPRAEAQLIDLRDWPFGAYTSAKPPTIAEHEYEPGTLEHRWRELIRRLDGFIFVSPEYNHSFPGHLKNAIDWLMPAWAHKPAAFVTYGGFAGGARAAEQLTLVLAELRMVPVRDQVNVPLINQPLDERGRPTAEPVQKKAHALLDELIWLTGVMREARAARAAALAV
jgi:NAD(P)H-dependent FMN reductase